MYIDLSFMRDILGIDGTSLDNLIEFYIKSATEQVINIIGRDISLQTKELRTYGNDNNTLRIDIKPLQSLTTITMNDVDITSDVEIINNGEYLYYSKGFSKGYDNIVKTSGYSTESYMSKKKSPNIKITGEFGYSEIPFDVQNVVSNIVQNAFLKSGINPQIKTEEWNNEFGKEKKEYFDLINEYDLSLEDLQTLSKYKL